MAKGTVAAKGQVTTKGSVLNRGKCPTNGITDTDIQTKDTLMEDRRITTGKVDFKISDRIRHTEVDIFNVGGNTAGDESLTTLRNAQYLKLRMDKKNSLFFPS